MSVDLTSDLGRRVAGQLTNSRIIWLTTLKPDGTPEPNPVWFYWDGANILIRSQDNPKVRNIAADPRVVLNFDTDASGSTVAVIHGTARVADEDAFASVRDGYSAKYADGLLALGTSAAQMFADYGTTIVIEPVSLRGW
ncbi:MAG: Pyridoxamine 5-phosphate oxidase-related, FMN-binding protein [Frankiales bacterium]|jgi:PPOX class probable F420-dependent enzyme|nr:Pyridoxamine 5-phosphate oxidase-related, FMN-binding protein [Frankiales bacterium]